MSFWWFGIIWDPKRATPIAIYGNVWVRLREKIIFEHWGMMGVYSKVFDSKNSLVMSFWWFGIIWDPKRATPISIYGNDWAHGKIIFEHWGMMGVYSKVFWLKNPFVICYFNDLGSFEDKIPHTGQSGFRYKLKMVIFSNAINLITCICRFGRTNLLFNLLMCKSSITTIFLLKSCPQPLLVRNRTSNWDTPISIYVLVPCKVNFVFGFWWSLRLHIT